MAVPYTSGLVSNDKISEVVIATYRIVIMTFHIVMIVLVYFYVVRINRIRHNQYFKSFHILPKEYLTRYYGMFIS